MKRIAALVAATFVTLALAQSVGVTRLEAQSSGAPVVISQIYGGGGNSGATLRHDFVELFNRSNAPVDVAGWSVQYASSTGTTWQRTDLAGVILPGAYYLVQEAAGAGGTQELPPPDAVGAIQMSASAGKVALVSSSVTLAGACPSIGIVDFVGFGPATNCAETQPTSPNLGSSTAALRASSGCQDTGDNSADFTSGTPTPRNSMSPPVVCGGAARLSLSASTNPTVAQPGEPLLITATVMPASAPASSGLSVTADLTSIGGLATALLTDDGIGGDAVAGDFVFSLLAVVALNTPAGDVSLVVTASDLEGRSVARALALHVLAPLLVRLPHDVQGHGATSPLAGQLVAVEGVVTARKFNGFFVQSRADEQDADPATSEGLFVFSGTAPPEAAIVGHRVRVTGRVTEFVPSTARSSLPLTEIAVGATVVDLGSDQLPAPVLLTALDINADVPLDALERFEGMRVALASLTVVAPTGGFVDENDATGSNNGVFYAVISGTARPFREAGIPVTVPVPPCTGCAPPRFDENPERLRVDSDAILGTTLLAVASGALLSDVVGVLDYGAAAFTLLPETSLTAAGGLTPAPVRAAAPDEFTVASFNLQRFFNAQNDPAISEPVLTPTAFDYRLAKASLIIREYLQLPDVLGVQEVEDLATLQSLAARLNADAQIGSDYVAYLEEGNDPGGIDVGLLVRSSRIDVTSVEQVGKEAVYTDPTDTDSANGNTLLLNDRPPLVVRATVLASTGRRSLPIIVVVNHLRSLNGVAEDPGAGPRVREKRRAQAEFLAALLDTLQEEAPVISVGDYNAFEVNDGYVDVLATIVGRPSPPSDVVVASPDLVEPDFVNAGAGRYSYVFDGNVQSLDHVLMSQRAAARFVELQHARVNADFPEALRGAVAASGAPRPERLSDHDPAVAYFAAGRRRTARHHIRVTHPQEHNPPSRFEGRGARR